MSASEFEGHEALVAQLRAGTLDAPDHLQRRVLAIRSEKRVRAPMSGRRKFVMVIGIAVMLGLSAAVVQGAISSGSDRGAGTPTSENIRNGGANFAPLTPPGKSGAIGVKGATGAKGPTGATGATGANGATGGYGFAAGAHGAAGPPGPTGRRGVHDDSFKATSGAPLMTPRMRLNAARLPNSVAIPTGRLVHAVATLQVAVANHEALTQATNDARQIVTRLGGYAQSVQYQFSNTGDGRAYLTLHVPLSKTETALTQLGDLGQVVYQQISTQDLVRTYTRQTSTIGKLQRQIGVYVQALQSGTLSSSERLSVQYRLSNARHALKYTRKARQHTVASGHTSDIQLNLTTSRHHGAAAGPHGTGRVGRMLHNVGTVLAVEAIVVLYVLIIGLPIILLGALIWWLTRGRRQRDEKRLLASA